MILDTVACYTPFASIPKRMFFGVPLPPAHLSLMVNFKLRLNPNQHLVFLFPSGSLSKFIRISIEIFDL